MSSRRRIQSMIASATSPRLLSRVGPRLSCKGARGGFVLCPHRRRTAHRRDEGRGLGRGCYSNQLPLSHLPKERASVLRCAIPFTPLGRRDLIVHHAPVELIFLRSCSLPARKDAGLEGLLEICLCELRNLGVLRRPPVLALCETQRRWRERNDIELLLENGRENTRQSCWSQRKDQRRRVDAPARKASTGSRGTSPARLLASTGRNPG